LDPNEPLTHFVLGDALLKQGQLEEAAKELLIAARSMRDPRPHVALGIVMSRLGKPKEAHTHLRDALKLDPANAAAKAELEWLEKTYPSGSLPGNE
jgi:Flp pilus assembly protein TadD